MSFDVAKRRIDFVSDNTRKLGQPGFEVHYHGGGEPTVHWRVMTESLGYARKRADELGLKVSSSAATNGVLGDPQINWVIENLDGVTLSFHGLPSAHDRHRLTVIGQGSSERDDPHDGPIRCGRLQLRHPRHCHR